jgi:hypothetical protein
MIKKIVDFIANIYVREMLFGFIIIVIANEYINVLFVKIILFIMGGAIAIRPMFSNEVNKEKLDGTN